MEVSQVPASRGASLRWVAAQVLLVVLGVLAYFLIRGLTESDAVPARRHARDLVELEQRLHVYVEPQVQQPLRTSSTLATVANWIYIWGHWPVLVATLAWLVWRHRDHFRRMRNAMVVSGGVGMAVFVSFPAAPPRLAGLGYVDTVTESSASYRYLQPPAFVDQYAAMPSLHAGWNLLAGIAVFSATSSLLLRIAACAMPALMAWAVIATGNHYVLDVVIGVALVVGGHGVALTLERHQARRARRRTEAGRDPRDGDGSPAGREGLQLTQRGTRS